MVFNVRCKMPRRLKVRMAMTELLIFKRSCRLDMAPIRVILLREPFSEYFTLTLPDHTPPRTEELEPDEVREWFRERGGDVEKLETVLDYCWNFPKPQTVVIANPRLPRRTILDPALDSTA